MSNIKYKDKTALQDDKYQCDDSSKNSITHFSSYLKDGERLDDLEYNGMYIISNKDKYCFTSDSVMLANLVKANRNDKIVDLCTGGGIIAILIAAKTSAKQVIGVEIQSDMADMAMRSVKMNNLQDKVSILNNDVIGINKVIGHGSCDIVVCNPPYYKVSEGAARQNECIAIARHEILLPLIDMIKSASDLVKFGGMFYMIHKSERLAEAIVLLSKHLLEPKILYNITTNGGEVSDTFIIVCKKGAKTGIIVHNINHI